MSRKGEFEINEMFIVILLLVGVLTAVWITGETGFNEKDQVQVTTKSIGALVDDGLAQAAQNFYVKNPSGNYRIDTQEWTLSSLNQAPDYISSSDATSIPTYPVLFDGKYLYEIRGFGAKAYERTDQAQPVDIECFAIFLGTSDTLNNYYSSGKGFEIKFYTYTTDIKLLENCVVESYQDAMTQNGNLLRTYYMHCNVVWGSYFE